MKKNGYIKTVKYSCECGDPYKYGAPYGSQAFSFLNGRMPQCASTAQFHPVVTSEEIVGEYDAIIEYTAVAAVYSFQRSRRWNISQIGWFIDMGLSNGEERFFRYHAVQLAELFGNSHNYMTAMREIERRCGLSSGTAYHPEIVRAFRDGRLKEYNALSGHCDEIDEIELVKSVDENLEQPTEPEVYEEIEEMCE